MREMIIELIKDNGPLSYGNILDLLKCDSSELAKEIALMEDKDVIKIGKLYYLIDGINYARGLVVVRNDNPYLRVDGESIYISKNIVSDHLYHFVEIEL